MKRKYKKIIIGSMFILVLIFLVIVFRAKNQKTTQEIIFIQKIPMSVEVTNLKIIGITVNNESLKFGTVMKGNFVEKGITIINPFNDPIKITINITDEINNFANISPQEFTLDALERKRVITRLQPLEETATGNYTGTMIVTFINQTQ